MRCSLQRATRTYPEIEFPDSNPEFGKLFGNPNILNVLVESNFTRTSNQARALDLEFCLFRTLSRTSHREPCAGSKFWGNREPDRKTGNLNIWGCRLESGLENLPEWRGLRLHGGWNAGSSKRPRGGRSGNLGGRIRVRLSPLGRLSRSHRACPTSGRRVRRVFR